MTSSTFDVVGVVTPFLSKSAHEIAIHVGIELELRHIHRLQNQSFIGGSFEVLPDSYQGKLVTSLGIERVTGCLTDCKA